MSVLKKRPKYKGDAPTPLAMQERREEIHKRHEEALSKVDELVRTQKQIGDVLDEELAGLRNHESTLKELEQREVEDGVMAMLVRRFTARRALLGRKSVAEGLLKQYELASLRLRQATSFSDELRLTSLELHAEVDRLHEDRVRATQNRTLAAERVLQIEQELQALEQGEHNLTDVELERQIDLLTFELRQESLNLELFRVSADLATHSLEPSRALRDTVLELHEGMSGYVLNASTAVDNAGRKIQALGMAADAPLVVAELQESLAELGTAMDVTATYVEETQILLTRVLPDLSTRIRDEVENKNLLLTDSLESVSRERARAMADKALRQAALAEVDAWLDDDGD